MEEYDYLDLLKAKFKYYGNSVKEGFDCFTLVTEIAKRRGIFMPNVNKQEMSISKVSILFTDTYNMSLFKKVQKGKNVLVLMKTK